MDVQRTFFGRNGLSYNVAHYIDRESQRVIESRSYVDLNEGDCMDRMAILYPIEKAYEAFMEYGDILNEAKLMRFDHKRYFNRMKHLFDAYQRNRDRLSKMDPVHFSDLFDCMDSVHGRLVEIYKAQESQGLLDSGVSGVNERICARLLNTYTLIRIAHHLTSIVRRNVEAKFKKRFGLLDFMDYGCAIKLTADMLMNVMNRNHIVIDFEKTHQADIAIVNLRESIISEKNYNKVKRMFEEEREGGYRGLREE